MSVVRLRIVVVLLLIGLSAVVARAVQVMVVDHSTWADRAGRQQQQIISIQSPRGEIRSADGYLLAGSVDRVAIQVDTSQLEYPELFARAAAAILDETPRELQRRLQSGSRMAWLAQKTTRETGRQVQKLEPGAVVLVPDSKRIYPLGTVAAPVVGFVGREELRTVGRAGFEHHYDQLLTGEPARYRSVRDAVQRQLRLQQLHPGRSGFDLELTLLARLQWQCEQELREAIASTGADAASAVVLEVHSGDILALASEPGYHPADGSQAPPANWRLRPVQDAFEPGSTIKPLIAATALATGAVAPGEVFDCSHHGMRVAGRWIRDHAEPGVYDLDRIIAQSSNTGIITVAQRLRPADLLQSLQAFGFGAVPGAGYPAETPGLLPPLARWSAMSPAGMALGQELTVSPLQLALAYASIANGGWLPSPHLARRADGPHRAAATVATGRRRIMDPALAARIRHMLALVVSEGTGSNARVPGYAVAGKTGTAQRASQSGFDDTHHTAWFAGFLPLPDPRVVIVVALEEPREDYWAASVAAPVFGRIAAAAVRQLDLPLSAPLLAAEAGHDSVPGAPA